MGLHGKDLLGATTILAVALLVAGWRISYLYGKEEAIRELEAKAAFESFSTYAGAPPGDGPRRFAVGLNACLDLIVPAIEGGAGERTVRDADVFRSIVSAARYPNLTKLAAPHLAPPACREFSLTSSRCLVSGVEEQKIFVGGNAALMGLTIKDKVRNYKSVVSF
eukprot:1352261-Amorphochlora_amoeboformis.AAC.1